MQAGCPPRAGRQPRLPGLVLAAALCALLLPPSDRSAASEAPKTAKARVVAVYPHDPDAFTQGLVFADGLLYESTGRYGASTLRVVDPSSGQVRRVAALPDHLFGEGITLWGEEIVQLTWRAGYILRWGRHSFEPLGDLPLAGEGWGLTDDGVHWIVSDGSDMLRFLDPADGHEVRRVRVRDNGRPVERLNELEYIDGEVWANIWYRDKVARIDPDSGRVLGYLDLSTLWPRQERPRQAVLNGLAYDEVTGAIYVTGKLWPRLFQIEILPPP